MAYVDVLPAITNEYSVGRVFSNTYGTIAMARTAGGTNSATSQWFINLGNNAALDKVDGGFTVFGQTLLGTNVLERFNTPPGSNGVYRVHYGNGAGLQTIPVLKSPATFDDLIYTAFTEPAWPRIELTVNPGGVRELGWQSLSNFVNRIEFTPSPGLPWQTLVATNGTGGWMTVADPETADRRLYRVRVE